MSNSLADRVGRLENGMVDVQARLKHAEERIIDNHEDHTKLFDTISGMDKKLATLLGRAQMGTLIINGFTVLASAVFGTAIGTFAAMIAQKIMK